MDLLVKLHQQVSDGFVNKQYTALISFDFEKAFDRIWRFKILKKLQEWNITGNLFKFIEQFLKKRTFQVRLNSILSPVMVQVNGTPQGSVISPTLFLIGISDLPNIIEAPVKYSVFADDLTIYMTSSNFSLLKEFLQNATNKLNAWSTQQGLRLSPSKTKCIIFSNKRKNPPNCIIKIGNESIENVSTIRILGLTLDRKLSWNDHIHNLKNQGIKSLNVLKMTAHKNWGADRKTLKNLYQSLSLSKIDYGSIIYNSAKSSTLKKLEPIQNSALRLIIGAMYTSPVSSLHVEANVLPLKFRRCFLSIKYYIKLLTRTTNPTYPNTVNPNFYSLYLKKANIPKPLGIRCKIDIENSNLQVPHNLTPNIIANF